MDASPPCPATKGEILSQSKLKQTLIALSENADATIAVAAATKLADLEIAQEKSESRVGNLRAELKSLQKERDAALQNMEAVALENTKLVARVAELEPLLAKAAELDAMKTEQEMWRAEQVKLLTAEANATLKRAQQLDERAREITAQAEARFSTERLRHSVLAWQKLAANEDMPSFFDNPGHSAFFWQSYDFFQEDGKATLWTANEDLKNNREQFMAYAARHLHIYTCGWCEKPEIPNIEQRVHFIYALADYLEIRDEVEEVGSKEATQHLAWHREKTVAAALTEERARSRAGVGRVSIVGSAEQQSSSAPLPHLEGCVCNRCGGKLPAHLRGGEMAL